MKVPYTAFDCWINQSYCFIFRSNCITDELINWVLFLSMQYMYLFYKIVFSVFTIVYKKKIPFVDCIDPYLHLVWTYIKMCTPFYVKIWDHWCAHSVNTHILSWSVKKICLSNWMTKHFSLTNIDFGCFYFFSVILLLLQKKKLSAKIHAYTVFCRQHFRPTRFFLNYVN